MPEIVERHPGLRDGENRARREAMEARWANLPEDVKAAILEDQANGDMLTAWQQENPRIRHAADGIFELPDDRPDYVGGHWVTTYDPQGGTRADYEWTACGILNGTLPTIWVRWQPDEAE